VPAIRTQPMHLSRISRPDPLRNLFKGDTSRQAVVVTISTMYNMYNKYPLHALPLPPLRQAAYSCYDPAARTASPSLEAAYLSYDI
jgi:hypothetical protein